MGLTGGSTSLEFCWPGPADQRPPRHGPRPGCCSCHGGRSRSAVCHFTSGPRTSTRLATPVVCVSFRTGRARKQQPRLCLALVCCRCFDKLDAPGRSAVHPWLANPSDGPCAMWWRWTQTSMKRSGRPPPPHTVLDTAQGRSLHQCEVLIGWTNRGNRQGRASPSQ